MSRKSRIAIPPGTKLDWNNPDHEPYIMDEAYAGLEDHPKPTMAPPERSRTWAFWKAFGLFIYMPGRKYLMKYLDRRWVDSVYGEFVRHGYWVYAWPFAEAIKGWIERGHRGGLRNLLRWLTDINVYSQCTWCGFTGYCDEHVVYEHPDDADDDGRVINMFEHVEGGDVDYWGEGQDAYGWKWCYRCGSIGWDSA